MCGSGCWRLWWFCCAALGHMPIIHFRQSVRRWHCGERIIFPRWYYYSAIAHQGLGNNVAALEHAKRAAALEPGNVSYQSLVNQLESGGNWYEQRQAAYGYPTFGTGNLCAKLCIANLICNVCCLGGGCCGGRGMYYY